MCGGSWAAFIWGFLASMHAHMLQTHSDFARGGSMRLTTGR